MWGVSVRKATSAAVMARNSDCNAKRSTQAERRLCATMAKHVRSSMAEPKSTIWVPCEESARTCLASQNVEEEQSQQCQDEGHAEKIRDSEEAQLGKHAFDRPDQQAKAGNFDQIDRQANR